MKISDPAKYSYKWHLVWPNMALYNLFFWPGLVALPDDNSGKSASILASVIH